MRDTLRPTESMQTYTARHLLELANSFDEFDLLGSGVTTLGEAQLPASFLRFRWNNGETTLEQSTYFLRRDPPTGREVRAITATVTAEDSEAEADLLEQIVATVRVRPTESDAPPAAPPRESEDDMRPIPFVPMPGYRD